MEDMKIQEARERREAINREERKVKESIDRYKLMREAMAKMLREERIQNEREKTKETDELLRVYQEREQQMVDRLKATQNQESQAKAMLQQAKSSRIGTSQTMGELMQNTNRNFNKK